MLKKKVDMITRINEAFILVRVKCVLRIVHRFISISLRYCIGDIASVFFIYEIVLYVLINYLTDFLSLKGRALNSFSAHFVLLDPLYVFHFYYTHVVFIIVPIKTLTPQLNYISKAFLMNTVIYISFGLL